jgi:hypothetical protein
MDHHQYWNEVHEPENKQWVGKPHGWIQWKGTDVCMDVRCICGARGHIDAEFFYHYKCLACGKTYAVGMNVPLIELTPEQTKFVEDGNGFITDPEVEL